MTVLALVNQKGGVGKTTVSLGLAAIAAQSGQSVLVVDIDPQANATTGLGVWKPTATIDQALGADSTSTLVDIAVESGWGEFFDRPPMLVASSPALAPLESHMASDPIGAQDRLSNALRNNRHDLTIIDCPPSMGLLSVNALFAADKAVVVAEPSAWSVDGVGQILRNIDRIAQRRAGALQLGGVVVNRLARTRDARFWDAELEKTYGSTVVRPPIASRAVIAEMSAQSQPITAATRSGSDKAIDDFTEVLSAVTSNLIGAKHGDV